MAKQKKQIQTVKDKAVIAKQNDKIIGDFLLQFAYTLLVGVVSIFVYNSLGLVNYGLGTYNVTKTIMWALFVISIISGIVLTILTIIKKNNAYKIPAIYSFVTAFVTFWYVGVEKVVFYGKSVLPFLNGFSGSQKILFTAFPLLAVALVAEFTVYFVRYYSLNGKKKK